MPITLRRMCVREVAAEGPVADVLRRMGFDVRNDALVKVVYGRDRDILKVLKEEDRPVLGVSPPGVEVRLAVADVRGLRAVRRCVKARVPRLAAENELGGIYAVNEVAFFASRPAVFVKYTVAINGVPLFNDVGDGVLVATPLGSTAYAMSAGGPRIMLHAEVLEIMPVNSALRRPPHVIPLRSVAEIGEAKSVEELWLIGDGSEKLRYRLPTWVYVDSFATLLLTEKGSTAEVHAPLLPSLLLVKRILAERGPMSAAEVAQVSGLKLRTVRYALAKLKEMGVVDAFVDPLNPRRCLYYLK